MVKSLRVYCWFSSKSWNQVHILAVLSSLLPLCLSGVAFCLLRSTSLPPTPPLPSSFHSFLCGLSWFRSRCCLIMNPYQITWQWSVCGCPIGLERYCRLKERSSAICVITLSLDFFFFSSIFQDLKHCIFDS